MRQAFRAMGFTATALLLVGLGSCKRSTTPPPRPAGVPAEAKFAGGADGGAFVRCDLPSRDTVNCTVWHDFTGEVLARGVFSLPGRGKPLPQPLEIVGWDGGLLLSAGSRLELAGSGAKE